MASLKYLDPITGEYKKVASGGGGTSIPASDTEPATGNYWLDTSAEGGSYLSASETEALVDEKIAAIPTGVEMELLWENASVDSGFPAQTITLDYSKYSHISIDYCASASLNVMANQIFPTYTGGTSLYYFADSWTPPEFRMRSVQLSDNGLKFFIARYMNNTATSFTESTAMIIPFRIYGIKGVTSNV